MAVNRPDFVKQIIEMWERLEWRQRITIIAFAALGIILIVSVVYFTNRVEYQTLYRDLNPEDAQAIVTKLEEDRRKFRVKGTSIDVAAPRDEIEKMRLEFAGAGLFRSGQIGYELLDKNQFGMTDFTEQVNLKRALEGELSRTISSLAEVSNSRVHLVLPKDSYFEASREHAKASVVLTLKNGVALSKSSVSGIRGLVAGAVPGLSVDNVSIVDNEGRFLAQPADAGDKNLSELELEMNIRDQLQKEMENKTIAILEPKFGKGNVQANATVEIDTKAEQATEELYTPNPQAIVGHLREEERAGGNILETGIPGTQSNVGLSEPSSVLTGPERFKEREITNYEVSKTVRHTVQPKGSIRRLTVAVTVNDEKVIEKGQDGNVTTKVVPLSEDERVKWEELVKAAVGYNADRGDVVTLRNTTFYDETAQVAPVPWYGWIQRQAFFAPAMKVLLWLLVLALIYMIFVRPLRNRVIQAIDAAAPALPPAEENLLLASGEAPAEALLGVEAAAAESAPSELPEPEPEVDAFDMDGATDEQIEDMLANEELSKGSSRRYAIIKKKLIDKARKNPELISQLIRSMMQEKA